MIDSAISKFIVLGCIVVGGCLLSQPVSAQEVLIKDNSRSLAPILKQDKPARPVEQKPVSLSDFHYVPPQQQSSGGRLLDPLREKAGVAMLSSAVVPGLGQAANGKWLRTGLYALAEAVTLGLHLYKNDQARDQEDDYHRYVNNNWSVVKYAKWLVDYNNYHNSTDIQYSQLGQNLGDGPAYSNDIDWDRVNINDLRELERQTIYHYPDGSTGERFSHELPDYGSQQYYELVSKYYQFGSGWRDFRYNPNLADSYPYDSGATPDNLFLVARRISDMNAMWQKGARLAEDFNDNYRIAGNMFTLLIVNHVVSAFDAFFTVKLKQHRLQAETTAANGGTLKLTYHF